MKSVEHKFDNYLITFFMNSKAVDQALKSLQFYEGIYHVKTLDRIERIIRGKEKICAHKRGLRDYSLNNNKILEISKENGLYSTYDQLKDTKSSKAHVNLLSELYFKGSQPRRVLPKHIRNLLDHPRDFITHWPYERDHSIICGEHSQNFKNSLRYLWKESHSKENLLKNYIDNFKSTPWLLNDHPDNLTKIKFETSDLNVSKQENREIEQELFTLLPSLALFEEEDRTRVIFPIYNEISQDIRDKTIRDSMRQYLFLKNNQKLFQISKDGIYYTTPIVNVPMTSLGQDIGVKRMKNLFYRKLALMKNTLIEDFPPLYEELQDELLFIMNDDTLDKKVKMLYKKLLIKNPVYSATGEFGECTFQLSPIMKHL